MVHRRNVVSPSSSLWVSTPQGVLMRRRVQEEGRSQCRPVMGRIGAGAPLRKQAHFPLVLRHEKVRPTATGGDADVGSGNACWCGLPGQPEAAPGKYRAGASAWRGHTASREGRSQGSSCMRGNVPVQFLVLQRYGIAGCRLRRLRLRRGGRGACGKPTPRRCRDSRAARLRRCW
jgi:hypothetical protein